VLEESQWDPTRRVTNEPTVKFRRAVPASPSPAAVTPNRSEPNDRWPEREPAAATKLPGAEPPRPPRASAAGASGRRRRPVLAGLALATMLVIAGGAWYVLLGDRVHVGRWRPATPSVTSSAGTVAMDSATHRDSAPARRPATPSARPSAAKAPPPAATPKHTSAARPTDTVAGAPTSARCRVATMADQRACLLAYVTANDAPLQRVYDALIAELRRSGNVERGAPDPPSVNGLRAEQRAWVTTRDRECTRRMPPGSVAFWAQPLSECFALMSNARVAELETTLRRVRAR